MKTETHKKIKRIGGRTCWFIAAAAFLIVAIPRPAQAQFGEEIAAILAGLQKVSSMLTSYVAKPLSQIQSVEQEEQKYQEEVIAPLQAINSARSLVTSLSSTLRSMQSLMNVRYTSATLQGTQQLEQLMVSANPNNIAGFANSYQQVYGVLPLSTAAPQTVRTSIDMTDAQAQDAMKKAIELDALAEREMEVAQSLNQQIQTAAPGTAPILEAEGSAWVLQGNAYSQSALAELLRVRSAALSNSSSALKGKTSQAQQLNQNLQGVMAPAQ